MFLNKKKLKFTKPSLKIENECILVGSSSSLLNNTDIAIDSFENIFRFNRAPTFGFEKHVGSRTDYRILNNHVFENRKKWNNSQYFSNQDFELLENIKNTNIIRIGTMWHTYKEHELRYKKNSNNVYIFDYSKINKLKKLVEFKSSKNMTVGAVTISLLLLTNVKINLIGFDLDAKMFSHYWERTPDLGSMHDKSYEKEWLRSIIKTSPNIKVLH